MKSVFLVVFGLWVAIGMAQDSPAPGINEFIFADVEPQPVNLSEIMKDIGYPHEAIEENVQGDVVVRILIDEEGNYIKHAYIKELHPACTAAIDEHIRNLTFTPALQSDKAIKYWFNLRIPFKIVEEERNPRELAVEILTEYLRQDSSDYQTLLKRGIQYRDLNKLDEAMLDFEASIAYNPESQPKPVAPVPDPKAKKKKKKKKKDALVDEQTAIPPDTLGPAYMFYALYAKGTVLSLKQDHEMAIVEMTKALDYTSKIKNIDSALQSSIANAYMERGFAASNMEKYEDALRDYQWVVDNAPEAACNVHQLMADIYLNQENFPALVLAYDRLIDCQGESPLLYYSRGYYKTRSGDYEGAIADFNMMLQNSKIINLKIASYNRIGWAYTKLGKYEEALAAIQKALDINVLNPQSYFYRGLIYQAQGKKEEACKEAVRANSYSIESTEQAELEKLIQELGCKIED